MLSRRVDVQKCPNRSDTILRCKLANILKSREDACLGTEYMSIIGTKDIDHVQDGETAYVTCASCLANSVLVDAAPPGLAMSLSASSGETYSEVYHCYN